MKNVRFWHMTPSTNWVKLTLRPGKEIKLHSSRFNGEGTSWECDIYRLEDDKVINDWAHGGNDCDGRHKSGGTLFCAIDKLQSREHWEEKGLMLPQWEKLEQWERDEFAENANY